MLMVRWKQVYFIRRDRRLKSIGSEYGGATRLSYYCGELEEKPERRKRPAEILASRNSILPRLHTSLLQSNVYGTHQRTRQHETTFLCAFAIGRCSHSCGVGFSYSNDRHSTFLHRRFPRSLVPREPHLSLTYLPITVLPLLSLNSSLLASRLLSLNPFSDFQRPLRSSQPIGGRKSEPMSLSISKYDLLRRALETRLLSLPYSSRIQAIPCYPSQKSKS